MKIAEWVEHAGLELSLTKSMAMLFTKSNSVRDFFHTEGYEKCLNINGVELVLNVPPLDLLIDFEVGRSFL